jgi:hypothetical protein
MMIIFIASSSPYNDDHHHCIIIMHLNAALQDLPHHELLELCASVGSE